MPLTFRLSFKGDDPDLRPARVCSRSPKDQGKTEWTCALDEAEPYELPPWRNPFKALAVLILRNFADVPTSQAGLKGPEGSPAWGLYELLRRKTTHKKIKTWIQRMFTSPAEPSVRQLPRSLFRWGSRRGGEFYVTLGPDWKGATIEIFREGASVAPSKFDSLADQIERSTEEHGEARPKELSEEIHLLAWNSAKDALVSVADYGLPLHKGDAIQISVDLSIPAYTCLIYLTSDSKAQPLNPWKRFQWAWPDRVEPIKRVRLPEQSDPANRLCFPINIAAGTETILLLARHDPLPPSLITSPSEQSHRLAAEASRVRLPDTARLYPFTCPASGTEPHLAIRLGSPELQKDPLSKFKAELTEKLGSRFLLIKGVSFATAPKPRLRR